MVVLLESSPISTQELQSSVRETIGFLVTSLTKALLHRLLSLVGRPALGRVLVFSKLPFKNGGRCVLGDLQCFRNILLPIARSVPKHNPVSELYGQFLQSHDLVFALTCTVNCGTFIQTVKPFQIMSNQLNLPQVASNQVVETSQGGSMEIGCT